jgi:DNA-binding NarL/FixJ family response regulator
VSALLEHRGAPAALRSARFGALVAVADPALRHAVTSCLRTLGAAEIVEAGSVAEARARARIAPHRDLAVAEIGLPDGSGASLLADLRAAGWPRVIAVSADADPFSVRAALAAGARALIVATGQPAAPHRTARDPRVESLSARELEVLQLVAEGRSNKDIGVQLGLSALTVKSHLARIGRKLGTGDRAEMVALALRAGSIS